MNASPSILALGLEAASNGMISPGEEYDRLCDELAREFLALENSGTGERAVSAVYKFRERYPGGHHGHRAPMILTLQGVAVPAHMDGRALADMLVA